MPDIGYRGVGLIERHWFQRLQAFEDAVAYRQARADAPCPDCGPAASGRRCDDHGRDLDLIGGYRRTIHGTAGFLRALHQGYLQAVIPLTMMTLPLGEVRTHLSELVGRVHDHHKRVIVTMHGQPSAVLLAVEDLERLEETLAILRDADTMRRLGDSDAELAGGETVSAEELGMSRSEFFARAGQPYLDELDAHSLTQQIDEALQLTGPDESTSDAAGTGRRRLAGDDQ